MMNVSGSVAGESACGDIILSEVHGDSIDVFTQGGDVKARVCTGRAMRFESKGGDINMHALQGSIDAFTDGGNIIAGLNG